MPEYICKDLNCFTQLIQNTEDIAAFTEIYQALCELLAVTEGIAESLSVLGCSKEMTIEEVTEVAALVIPVGAMNLIITADTTDGTLESDSINGGATIPLVDAVPFTATGPFGDTITVTAGVGGTVAVQYETCVQVV